MNRRFPALDEQGSKLVDMNDLSSLPPLHQVPIALADRSYLIDIGHGLLDIPPDYALPQGSSALVVSNETVAPLYLERLKKSLAPHYRQVFSVLLPDGEAHKTWESLNLIFDALLSLGCDRKTVLFALGGGVVGDAAERRLFVVGPGRYRLVVVGTGAFRVQVLRCGRRC